MFLAVNVTVTNKDMKFFIENTKRTPRQLFSVLEKIQNFASCVNKRSARQIKTFEYHLQARIIGKHGFAQEEKLFFVMMVFALPGF